MQKPVLLHCEDNSGSSWKKYFAGFNCQTAPPHEITGPLVRWGNIQGTDNRDLTLNRKESLVNALNREKALQFLRLNRIRQPKITVPTPSSPYPLVARHLHPRESNRDRIIYSYAEVARIKADFFVQYIPTLRDYKAWVFDAKVFYLEKKVPVVSNTSLWLSTPSEQYEPVPVNLDSDTEKACLLAVKATHLLGLDFAKVRLGVDMKNRPVVLDVNPVPNPHPEASPKLVQLIKKRLLARQHRPASGEIWLGADPEFILRNKDNGNLIYPSHFIQKDGLFGYDERSERREGRLYPLAEIRPTPDTCPLRLTEKIRHSLQYGVTRIPYKNVEWLAGSIHYNRYQIGGHIHFSGVELSSALLRALDNYLAIPVSLIEDREAAVKRRKQYGGLGNIRNKPHGGFEYRTLGSWLVSPEITRATLCLALLVAYEHHSLKRDFFQSYEMQRAFYKGQSEKFYELFPLLWEDIKQTHTYWKYEKELQIIPDMISRRETWDEQQDIRMKWRLEIPGMSWFKS